MAFVVVSAKMATMNPFDLLGDDAEDPSQLIVAEQLKAAAAPPKKAAATQEQGKQRGGQPQPNKPAQLPSKPAPPAQAGQLQSLFMYSDYLF